MPEAKALVRLRICAGSSGHSQITNAISINISCADPYYLFLYLVDRISHFFTTEIYSAVPLYGYVWYP